MPLLNSHEERLNGDIERRFNINGGEKGDGERLARLGIDSEEKCSDSEPSNPGNKVRSSSARSSSTRSPSGRRSSSTVGSTSGFRGTSGASGTPGSTNFPLTSSHPPHLSEFYSFMNNKSNIPISPTQSTNSKTIREPSLHTFTSFLPSVMDLPNIVATKDFNQNVGIYKNLLSKAEGLRKSLLTVSTAANEFGQALEDCINECPKVNNSKVVSDGLINAGGLQYMIGSNQQILSRLIETNFEDPLRLELDHLCREYDMNHIYYQQEIKLKSKLLREKELENIKLSKQKTRNLNTYKNNLLHLTNHLEEIDRLKYDYYHEINSMIERFNQDHILIRTGSLVRAQLEIFEGIAKKGWSGGGLDDLLSISPDIFEEVDNAEGAEEGEVTMELDDEVENENESVHDPVDFPQISPRESAKTDSFRKNDLVESKLLDSRSFEGRELTHDSINDSARNSIRNSIRDSIHESARNSAPDSTQDSTKVNLNLDPEPIRQSSPDHLLSKLTNSFTTILRSTDPDTSNDESFSLPVINQASLLGLRGKSSDIEISPENDTNIDKDNILEDLDT
jgi:hypothetical protein